jgi:hypothetical protein
MRADTLELSSPLNIFHRQQELRAGLDKIASLSALPLFLSAGLHGDIHAMSD